MFTIALCANVTEHGNVIEDDGDALEYLASLHRAGSRLHLT
jgi:hypothetical protein